MLRCNHMASTLTVLLYSYGLHTTPYPNCEVHTLTVPNAQSLAQGEFTELSDIFSYGVLLWEILSLGGTPYGAPRDRSHADTPACPTSTSSIWYDNDRPNILSHFLYP